MKRRDPGIIPPPKHCPCGRPASLIRIEVYRPGQPKRIGAFSDFGEVKQTRAGRKLILKRGYLFARWIPECTQCLEAENTMELFA